MPYKIGLEKIKNGQCEMGFTLPIACSKCIYGHATECHYPMRCAEAKCGHLRYERENKPFILPDK